MNPSSTLNVTGLPMIQACTHSSIAILLLAATGLVHGANTPVDLSRYRPECGVSVHESDGSLDIAWPIESSEYGRVQLTLADGPLVKTIGHSRTLDGDVTALLSRVEPVVYLTVGTREMPPGKPADQQWQVFFDNPATRPHDSYVSKLQRHSVRVESDGRRAIITIREVTVGPFKGVLQLVFYPNCRLIQIQPIVSTSEDRRAIVYDTGILGEQPGWKRCAWMSTEGQLQRESITESSADRPIPVRHRALFIECEGGTVACFPPPHQFFFPRDYTDNLSSVWVGRDHLGLSKQFGFGLRTEKTGGGRFVPWFNAPPGSPQRLGSFLLISKGDAASALRETLRYTHGDRFPELPGRVTMTSHWHMAIAVAAQQRQQQGLPPVIPEFVQMFKDMNVQLVHLGEFHGDGHQDDPGPVRLPELAAMFDECRRLSDEQLLLIPGEEINKYLGLESQGRHPGHWMSLFPRPVYWTLQRRANQPFMEEHARYGRVYHVGSREDMSRLIAEERALVWSAHPRIKASSWTPDVFREEDFFVAESWLGAAWKAMPGDLSQPRLGQRVLDLLDDMSNWGRRKQVLGEVDVFKLDHTHELYGHMNVNYLRLDRVPRFDEGWEPVLKALRDGAFFVTTGEMLIPDFTVDGHPSGESVQVPSDGKVKVHVELQWTFPPTFAELVSGDGERVYREFVDLTGEEAFGRRAIDLTPTLKNRTWARFEVWDCATNGAFTQPVWLRPSAGK